MDIFGITVDPNRTPYGGGTSLIGESSSIDGSSSIGELN